ncbi:HDOD domain-containing protein [Marinomonas transparens]|uniref:HDOD domain-containing protein n=1 Tax=Marinomonas transparens TaxID=2795388 RepID=A0A934MVX3_9GAMM|nr:HDOD domain-containing protein [Marinomonas transparens]MBJ7537534.1 HDOD domain-containing protein [Marinomonas transparens]
MKDKSPLGLNEWLDFLKNKKFPVKADNLSRLQTQIKRTEDTLDKMQSSIASEPLLAFVILNEANRVVPNKNSEIKTPFHAASMVGMNGIENLFVKLTTYKLTGKRPAHLAAFLKQVQTSYEAATIARHLSIEKLSSHEDDIFWITLFRDTTRWLLWFHAYPVMEELDKKIKQGQSANKAEMDILGCRLDEITVHMCNHWGTPAPIIESFLTKHIPNSQELQALAHLAHHQEELPGFIEDKRLTILANSPLIFSYCANKIAHEATNNGWESKNLPFFYRILATVIHCYHSKIIHSVHLASTEAARLYNNGGKAPLANQLLDPNLYLNKKTTIAVARTTNAPILTLKKQVSQSQLGAKEKANLALKAIKQSIKNAKRTIVLKHSNNKVSPLFQFGYDTEKLKKTQWNTPSKVFEKLSKKRSATHLSGAKLKNLLKDLPHTADQLINNNSELMLASAPISSTEVIIFWLETSNKFDEKNYKDLKQIVALISHTI